MMDVEVGDVISLKHGMPWYSGRDDFPLGFMEAGTKLQVVSKLFDGGCYHVKAKLLAPWFNLDDKEVMNLNESSLDFFEKV